LRQYSWVPSPTLDFLENSGGTARVSLFFHSSDRRRPRISAKTRCRWLIFSRENSKNSKKQESCLNAPED
jgi:hypothetical protein